jgi:hypothetical protein
MPSLKKLAGCGRFIFPRHIMWGTNYFVPRLEIGGAETSVPRNFNSSLCVRVTVFGFGSLAKILDNYN